MEQLIEEKKYFHEIFSVVLPKHIIEQIIIKTISDEEIGKYVDEKIVKFVNRHSEEPNNQTFNSENIELENITIENWKNITIEKMNKFKEKSWYIADKIVISGFKLPTVIIFTSIAIAIGWDFIKEFLKINEIKIIKDSLGQYLINT